MKTTRYLRKIRLAGVVAAISVVAAVSAHAGGDSFQKDREAILAMAGDFRVTFRFDETLTLDPDAKASKREVSRGHETVRIVSDNGDFIQMQHLLVVQDAEGNQTVVKHWRQDWAYEASNMLVYRGEGIWENVLVARGDRKGAWTQTVYQVDDSPRYAGYGRWVHMGEYAYWQSNETWRPLPRRELKQRNDYDVLVGTNRHSLTPEGWAHEQDNYKLALDKDGDHVLAREAGVNTYDRIAASEFDFTVADEYWTATEDFWRTVRDHWATLIDRNDTIYIEDEIDSEKLYARVMPIAENVRKNETSTQQATKAFRQHMARYVNPAKSTSTD